MAQAARELGLRVFEDVFITAHHIDGENKTYSGRLFDRNGNAIGIDLRSEDRLDTWRLKDADQVSSRRSVGSFKTSALAASMHLKEAIWGGYLFDAWGHALVESLATAWAIGDLPPHVPVVFYAWGSLSNETIEHRTELLRLAGWCNPIITTTGPCSVGKLLVPDRGLELSATIYDRQPINRVMNRVYDNIAAASVTEAMAPRPIYLARPLGHRRETPHEQEVARRLCQHGVKILEGWAVPLTEQIATVANASMIIAPSGSSLHNSVFAPRGCAIVELQDERASRRGHSWDLQAALVELRDQRLLKIPAIVEGQSVPVGAILTQIAPFLIR